MDFHIWIRSSCNGLKFAIQIRFCRETGKRFLLLPALGRCLLLLLCIRSAHLESGPRYQSFLMNLPTNTKQRLRKGYESPKENRG